MIASSCLGGAQLPAGLVRVLIAALLLVRHYKLGNVTSVDCAAFNRELLCEQRGQEPATVLLVLRVLTV